jgi:TPR repeat protein
MHLYALLCYSGNEIPANFEEAFKYFSVAAERGHPESVYYLGRMYIEGKYVTRDPFKAFKYFERAAELNVVDAKVLLGVCFYNGIGTATNQDLGLQLLKNGFDAGNQLAINFYSRITGQKLRISTFIKDTSEGAKFYDLNQVLQLGHLYCYGWGVERDLIKAYKVLKMLSNKRVHDFEGTKQFVERFGFVSESDSQNVKLMIEGLKAELGLNQKKDPVFAAAAYKELSEGGLVSGMVKFGECLRSGCGCPQDGLKAVLWFTRAVDFGNSDGCYELGLCHWRGECVEQNRLTAADRIICLQIKIVR